MFIAFVHVHVIVPHNRKRKQRCGVCEECIADDCGTCKFCLDKKRFGGAEKLRQCCIKPRCKLLKGKCFN